MKTTPWEPETDLDRELIAVGVPYFAALAEAEALPKGRINWRFTQHCIDRWHERFNATEVGAAHPLRDVRNPRLRLAGTKERQHILAQCPAHSGAAARGSLYFVLPDPTGGSTCRVFVVDLLVVTDKRFDPTAAANYLVVTCFPLRAFKSASHVKNHGHQKRLRLKRG